MIAAFQLSSFAQGGGGFQRQTPEEQAAKIHHVLDSAFSLGATKLAPLDTALTVVYTKQNDRMKELMSGGERPDRETIMAERKKYSDARDAMIQSVLNKEQFGIWKEKIEPGMQPQRQGGGMGGSGGGNRGNNK